MHNKAGPQCLVDIMTAVRGEDPAHSRRVLLDHRAKSLLTFGSQTIDLVDEDTALVMVQASGMYQSL